MSKSPLVCGGIPVVAGCRLALLLAVGVLVLGSPQSLCPAEAADEDSHRGVAGRAGYIAFESFGRDDSLSHVEVLPYVTSNEHTFFSDLRLFSVEGGGSLGGNFGFGVRRSLTDYGRFLGASVWYDFDDSTGELFNQVGVSLETCGTAWDARANLYIPVGDKEKDYGYEVRNQQFAGNQVTYDGLRRYGEAMEGFDLEFALLLPGEAAANHDVRAAVGYYHFIGDVVDDIDGFKVRGEGNISDYVTMQVELTDDRTFGTNITLGVAIVLPGGFRRHPPRGTEAPVRIDRFVRRNYNIIVSQKADLETGLVAINPDTGNPYVIQHVSSTAGGLNLGTVDDPFGTVADAQAVAGDIIFVHSGSVLDEQIVLTSGQQLLGEGVRHAISYGRCGYDGLPTTAGTAIRPTIRPAAGTAVTLASDSRLSGFVVESPAGNGIVGSGVSGATVSDVDVAGAALDGIRLQNAGSDNRFERVNIAAAADAALHIDGGSPDVDFQGTIDNTSGRALVVENISGGTVNLTEADIEDDGGQGVLISDVDGEVSLGRVVVRNSTTTGVDVQGGSGTIGFEELVVENAAGAGVNIENAAGSIKIDSLSIDADGATGLYARDSGNLTIEAGTVAATSGTAIDIENTTLDVDLTSVSSTGAGVGVRLVDTSGSLFVYGNEGDGTGGLIQNSGTGVLLVNAGKVGFNYLDLDANGTGVDVADTSFFILSHARVTDSVDYAINARNTATLEVLSSSFANNGTAASNTIRVLADADGDYVVNIRANTFADETSAAVAIQTSGAGDGSSLTLLFDKNDVTATRFGADAVRLGWNGAVLAKFLENSFTMSGGSNTGLDLAMNSTTELAQLVVTDNTFSLSDGSDTGLRLATLGPSYSYIGDNEITLDGADSVGIDFTLAKSAEVHVDDNRIVDSGGGTGILFQSIDGPSIVTINGNTISLEGATAAIDRGIIFSTVTDTITLVASKNNIVNGATTPFYVPQGTTTGYILVNGVTLP